MQNSELRTKLVEDHRLLRMQIRGVNAFAERACRDCSFSIEELRSVSRELVSSMLAHMAEEERALVPVLQEIDSWGPARAAKLEQEHHWQREMLSAFLQMLRGEVTNQAVAAAASIVTRTLLTDMEEEERELFSSALLRDDVVAIDQSDG